MVGVHARTNSCSWFYSVVLAERDENVFEIWDQPEPVPIIKYTKKTKREKTGIPQTFLYYERMVHVSLR